MSSGCFHPKFARPTFLTTAIATIICASTFLIQRISRALLTGPFWGTKNPRCRFNLLTRHLRALLTSQSLYRDCAGSQTEFLLFFSFFSRCCLQQHLPKSVNPQQLHLSSCFNHLVKNAEHTIAISKSCATVFYNYFANSFRRSSEQLSVQKVWLIPKCVPDRYNLRKSLIISYIWIRQKVM